MRAQRYHRTHTLIPRGPSGANMGSTGQSKRLLRNQRSRSEAFGGSKDPELCRPGREVRTGERAKTGAI